MRKKDFLFIFIISEVIFVSLLLIYLNLSYGAFEAKTGLEIFILKIIDFLKKFNFSLIYLLALIFPVGACFFIFLASIFLKKIKSLWQFVKFVFVGASNTFLDLGVLNFIYFLFREASRFYPLCKSFSFLVAVANSYLWNKAWVFEVRKEEKIKKESLNFFLVSLGGLGLNVALATFLARLAPNFGFSLKISANLGAVFGAFGSMLWNFFGYKIFVFKK